MAKVKRRKGREFIARVKRMASCSNCGYDKCPDALEFHHKEPQHKEVEINKIRDSSIEKIKEELRKCEILCANCHREIHYFDPKLARSFNQKKDNRYGVPKL